MNLFHGISILQKIHLDIRLYKNAVFYLSGILFTGAALMRDVTFIVFLNLKGQALIRGWHLLEVQPLSEEIQYYHLSSYIIFLQMLTKSNRIPHPFE